MLQAVVAFILAAGSVDLDVQTIVDRHLQAIGGRAAVHALKSWRMSGTITAPDGRLFRFHSERKRPNLCRWEDVASDGASRMRGYNGKVAWASDRSGVRVLHGEAERERIQTCEFEENPLVDYASRGISVSGVGTVDVDGSRAYKLDTRAPDGNHRIVYIDATTFLEVRIDFVERDGTITVQRLSDRRIVSGVGTATTWVMTDEAGRDPMKSHAETIEGNVEIPASRFDPPGK